MGTVFCYGVDSLLRKGFVDYVGSEDQLSIYRLMDIPDTDIAALDYKLTRTSTTWSTLPAAIKATVSMFQ